MKNIKFYKKGCVAITLAAGLSLTGCGESTYVPLTANETNTIDSNQTGEMSSISKEVEVPREDFKLEISYSILPPDKKLYCFFGQLFSLVIR